MDKQLSLEGKKLFQTVSPQELPGQKAGRWTDAESQMLTKAVAIYGADRQWPQVSQYMVDNGVKRGPTQCRHRWSKTLRPNIKKGSWNANEDRLLRVEVNKCFARGQTVKKIIWREIADSVLPTRTGKACWERWIYRLDPAIDRSPFTPEQDSQLLSLQSEVGNKWASIAKKMSKGQGVVGGTRTADQIKSRYITLCRASKRAQGSSSAAKPMPAPRNNLGCISQLQRESDAAKRERSTSSHLMHTATKRVAGSAGAGCAPQVLAGGDAAADMDMDSINNLINDLADISMSNDGAGHYDLLAADAAELLHDDLLCSTSSQTSDKASQLQPRFSLTEDTIEATLAKVENELDDIFADVEANLGHAETGVRVPIADEFASSDMSLSFSLDGI